jgi:hypothetical protein
MSAETREKYWAAIVADLNDELAASRDADELNNGEYLDALRHIQVLLSQQWTPDDHKRISEWMADRIDLVGGTP